MTDEFRDLEAELKALKPKIPSPRLHRLLKAGLDPKRGAPSKRDSANFRDETPSEIFRWLGWGCAAAFLATFMFLAAIAQKPSPSSLTALAPSESTPSAETIVLGTEDEGVITLPDGSSARRYRIRAVDTYTWRIQAANATMRWSVPREDVRLVPINFF